MQRIIEILSVIFAIGLIACDNQHLTVSDPQLNICSAEEVDDLVLNVTRGSATVKVVQITYENDQSFNTNIELKVSMGDVVTVPYCDKQNVGDVRFRIEVVPSGPPLHHDYDYSVEIYYEVTSGQKDIRIWDANGFETFSSGSAGIATHTNGETDNYNVAIEPWVW